MAGDRVREAFKTELAAIITGASIPWAVKDVENVFASATGETELIALEFDGGPPQRAGSFGQPNGSNFFIEEGNVWIRVVAPLGTGNDVAGYARTIADAFLQRRFTMSNGRGIRTMSGPPGPTRIGGRWIESIPVAYRVYNLN
jgi:hypothetical protein